jgi:antitoxin HicB
MSHLARSQVRPPFRTLRKRERAGILVDLGAMATSREFEVVLTPEESGGYSVSVPALPGCTSQGGTREEALAMIRQAIELYLESLDAHGDPLPAPIEIERVTVDA